MTTTLDSPVYEVKKDSPWYQTKLKQRQEIDQFFVILDERYGMKEGFGFYHAEYFGLHEGTVAYEKFKDELLKNPTEKDGFHPFKKRSKYYKEINTLLKEITELSPFRPHDTFGLNNIKASQWIKDRWFFQVIDEKMVKSEEVQPISYKDYLHFVIDTLDISGDTMSTVNVSEGEK